MVKTEIKKQNTDVKILNHNVYLEDQFAYPAESNRISTKKFVSYSIFDQQQFLVLFKNQNYSKIKTKNQQTSLNYINKHTKRIYKFYCFRDEDLKFPNQYSQKTIQHVLFFVLIEKQNIDNDCSTDDQQINGAIIKLYRNLESGIKDTKKIKMPPSY